MAATKNWYVRASSGGNEIGNGRIRSMYRDSVTIGTTRIPLSAITELDRRLRVGGGATAGAISGGLVMGGFLWTVLRGLCEGDCGSVVENVGAFAVGAAVGVPVGAFVGEAIKPAKHSWVHIWP
jgi:hypothetical protein